VCLDMESSARTRRQIRGRARGEVKRVADLC